MGCSSCWHGEPASAGWALGPAAPSLAKASMGCMLGDKEVSGVEAHSGDWPRHTRGGGGGELGPGPTTRAVEAGWAVKKHVSKGKRKKEKRLTSGSQP
jgi:hypothetical protein